MIGATGLCGVAICGGVTGSIGMGVGELVVGGGTCETPNGLPGAGFGILPALSGDASEEAPPGVIDAVPAGGLVM